ncbi:Conserved Plasmodium membrane protein, related [Eimeria tenella]|uniref:Conserved Plasmodium membrane protein, related n=1 Tax=Eimeria tenella TaxID=5802 RepID=U6LA02_EIMTE|nr:Conserved Plasmodium membrane protein, related [Eimeria tenella]CDJ44600.1 Conserved Plasmodium membrane protein, related [Eimeria tenella]|eukprot:XP_013235348.1 Conserved Plasmodium membrane protein, related [Eimeria tenella]
MMELQDRQQQQQQQQHADQEQQQEQQPAGHQQQQQQHPEPQQQQQQQQQRDASITLEGSQGTPSPEELQSFLLNIEDASPESFSPADEYRPAGSPRYSVWGAGRQSESEPPETPEGWISFLKNTIPFFFGGNAVKQRQAKLLLIEALDHFDMINDLFFILRVSLVLWRRGPFHELRSVRFVLLWLSCLRLFMPFAVFNEIKRAGVQCPQALFMFERLTWTFQLLMRLVEDLPQLIMSLIYLINNGKDIYAIVVISYSSTMFLITSIRMGKRYPFRGTLYLLFSSRAPM